MKRSIRVRLLVGLLAVLVPAGVGAGWLLLEVFGNRLVRDIDVALTEEAETIGELAAAQGTQGTVVELVRRVASDHEFGADKYIVVTRNNQLLTEMPPGALAALREGDARLHIVHSPAPEAGVDVAIGIDRAGVVHATRRLRSLLVVGVPMVLLLIAMGLWTVIGRALRPLEEAARYLGAVGTDTLSLRVPVANPDDEVGRVVRVLNGVLDRLSVAVGELRRFTADAAHALRTPLTVLRAGLEVALTHERSAPEYRAALEEALVSTKRMSHVADRLLTLARIEASETRNVAPVEMGEVLHELAEAFAGRAAAHGQTVQVRAAPELWVRADPADVYRLFSDLIDNAVRYGVPNRHGVPGTVVLSAGRTDGQVCVTITDAGPGIDRRDLPHVFDRFYRGSAPRSDDGGTGLGLSIARHIVHAHGGSIDIRNGADGGCVVTVTLPALPEAAFGMTPHRSP